jgi:hypothetical protein
MLWQYTPSATKLGKPDKITSPLSLDDVRTSPLLNLIFATSLSTNPSFLAVANVAQAPLPQAYVPSVLYHHLPFVQS